MNSTTEANSTLDSISDTRVLTDLITLNLTQIKIVVERILNLSISFSIEEAEALAQQINETILPPEVVREIIRNATVVKQVANQTLEAAMEARYVNSKVYDCTCHNNMIHFNLIVLQQWKQN